MTAAEASAITILTEMVKQNAVSARKDHEDTARRLSETEVRLVAKIDEKDLAIKTIIDHCAVRKREVDAALAKELVATDAHIAAAKLEAVAEALPKPSVYVLATKGAMEGLFRFASRAAVVVALAASLLVLIDKLGLL